MTKRKGLRMLPLIVLFAMLSCGFASPAYAYADDTEQDLPITEATKPEEVTEEPPVSATPTPDTEAFDGEGNAYTRDLLYDKATNKQFITVQSKSGNTFYIVIDYDAPINEEEEQYQTYFLNLVDDRDLLALLSEEEKPTPTPTVAPTPTPTKEPVQMDEPEPKQDGTVIVGALMLAILGGGAFWYLKQRKKKESKPQPSYDEYEDDEDDETGDDDLNE